MLLWVIALFHLITYPQRSNGQYGVDTYQYQLGYAEQQALLTEEVESLNDTNLHFFPQRQFLFANSYTFDFLTADEYKIGVLIDPCRYNSFNCCVNGTILL